MSRAALISPPGLGDGPGQGERQGEALAREIEALEVAQQERVVLQRQEVGHAVGPAFDVRPGNGDAPALRHVERDAALAFRIRSQEEPLGHRVERAVEHDPRLLAPEVPGAVRVAQVDPVAQLDVPRKGLRAVRSIREPPREGVRLSSRVDRERTAVRGADLEVAHEARPAPRPVEGASEATGESPLDDADPRRHRGVGRLDPVHREDVIAGEIARGLGAEEQQGQERRHGARCGAVNRLSNAPTVARRSG